LRAYATANAGVSEAKALLTVLFNFAVIERRKVLRVIQARYAYKQCNLIVEADHPPKTNFEKRALAE